MKKKMVRFLALMLCAGMLFGMLPMTAFASETEAEENAVAVTEETLAPEETVGITEETAAAEETVSTDETIPEETAAEETVPEETVDLEEAISEETVAVKEILTADIPGKPASMKITEHVHNGRVQINFTTFEDLQELAARTYNTSTSVVYQGSAPLVIESDLTLPEKLVLYASQLKIPAGVTVVSLDTLGAEELVIEGTLDCAFVYVNDVLTITGSVTTNGYGIYINETTVVTGADKIIFDDFSANLIVQCKIEDMASLKAAIKKAETVPDHWGYQLYVQKPLVVDESITIPRSCDLLVNEAITVMEYCTLEVSRGGALLLFAPMVVNGTLISAPFINIYPGNGGKLTISDSGSCTSDFSIWEPELADSYAALSGVDLSNYEVTDDGQCWLFEYFGPSTTPMYRLYNPNSGEHFYTGSEEERDVLDAAGWKYEGIAWNAPTEGGLPIHRVYNPNAGDHHYTGSMDEVDTLVAAGWKYEGVCWNTPVYGIPVHRLYNPNAVCGSHHYTTSAEERDILVDAGWKYENVAWNGVDIEN